ncbi:fetuin-B isoform X2 [Vicugna pacos]|uniref:Fetuin-B isoform X2 n=1 Tax=Vicugna pacos TaxID=30538 RepID=A0A6I9I0G3_VICPA|nr:fetuin-B isoform X1 [Vicugna pacos]
MGLLLPLALCALVVCCGAAPPTQQAPSPSPLLSHSCNSSYVLEVANFVLQDINRNRKDGYVLSLNRVSDVREHRQGDLGSLFYYTLDVLETDCHVLSRRSWKSCSVRYLHLSVYGQCKAIFYINEARRIFYLAAYNCTLRPVSQLAIVRMCPDCPGPAGLSEPRVWEAVTESLAEYNSRSTSKYSLVKITKASSQWVTGPAYFVEYLITESPCAISQASSCALQSSDSVPVGLCKGSLNRNEDDDTEKLVWVTCEFFKSQVPTPGGQNATANQGPTNLPKEEEPRQKNTARADSPAKAVPEGAIRCLPSLDDEDSGQSQGKGPVEAFPVQLDLTTNPQGEPLDVSFLLLKPVEEELVVLPFPSKEQRSAECPGPAQNANPLILPP